MAWLTRATKNDDKQQNRPFHGDKPQEEDVTDRHAEIFSIIYREESEMKSVVLFLLH